MRHGGRVEEIRGGLMGERCGCRQRVVGTQRFDWMLGAGLQTHQQAISGMAFGFPFFRILSVHRDENKFI